jgi:hypothetical protein
MAGRTTVDPPTCGLANSSDPAEQKCCTVDAKKILDEQTDGVVSVVPDGVRFFFEALMDLIVEPIRSNDALALLNQPCLNGVPEGEGDACTCRPAAIATPSAELRQICERYIKPLDSDSEEEMARRERDRNECLACAGDKNGFYSGMGCIPTELDDFISEFVLRIGIGLAGFIAFMCILYSSFLLQTSQGNPDTIQTARDQITSCLIGLLMIIFSVFILRLIGVDILRLPGFS